MAARILIAEDTQAHAKLIRFGLESAGFEVTVARDGRKAWMEAQLDHFELVITDYKMPDLSGVELCQLLRQDPRYLRTPIILISAFCRELDLSRSRRTWNRRPCPRAADRSSGHQRRQ